MTLIEGVCVPHWVPDGLIDAFIQANAEDRAALYYVWATRAGAEQTFPALYVDYDEVVSQPSVVMRACSDALGLEFGAQTEAAFMRVKSRASATDPSVFRRISQPLRDEAFDSWAAWKARATELQGLKK